MSILLARDTQIIVQGITGREAINLTRENLAYGTRIVGGVTPGRAGRDIYGVPVFDTVREAVAANAKKGIRVTGSIVSVPPNFTQDAIFEAASSPTRPTRPGADRSGSGAGRGQNRCA